MLAQTRWRGSVVWVVMCVRGDDASGAIRTKCHDHAAIHRIGGDERHRAVAVAIVEIISGVEVRVKRVVDPLEVRKVLAHHVPPARPVAVGWPRGVRAGAIGRLVHDMKHA